MQFLSAVTSFLFTDIEGSGRLWEQQPERMQRALACHDAIARAAVEGHRGVVVKMTGDGVHAAFDDPLDAVGATLELQQALADPEATGGIALQVRCGLHAGVDERRDNDFFGRAVNRAARIVDAAHGGQVLVSQAVAVLVGDRLSAGVALRDLGFVRLRDLASPERVYQLVHAKLRKDFPALRSLEAIPSNLPQQVTSFVGRERELSEVKSLLGKARLLTLFGVGGIGKTRLSLQVGADVMDDYRDGVWFVELAGLTDAQLVVQAVASVLSVKEAAGRTLLEDVIRQVQAGKRLLILDNCEHLVQACAELARHLLRAGSELKILASSREPLHTEGETTWQLPPLPIPNLNQSLAPNVLAQYEGVRLFVDRAAAVQPAFELTEDNAEAVAAICHRLDGIPLALELAAARVRTLSVKQIATRLDDRFQLLTGGYRTAMPRQQTLRALIDWSYDLLATPERTLLRRLAVFAGGFTLGAAEAVGGGGEIGPADVLELLCHLVEKSLVTLGGVGERYRLLETVRQYAHEKLNESGEAEAVLSRHLTCYLALAEQARPGLIGPEQGTWLSRLDVERENLLSAHAWCDRAKGGAEAGLQLAYCIKHYWLNRGLLGLGYRVTVEALARSGAQERSVVRCRGLFDAGQLSFFMGRYGEAQAYLEESLEIAREIGDQGMVAMVLQPLGMAYLGQGDADKARGPLEEAVTLARTLGDRRQLAAALNALAQLHRLGSEPDRADPLYENVVALARELGDRDSIAIGLLNLAMTSIGRGAGDRARGILLEVLQIAEEIGSKPAGQSALEVSAGLAALGEDWERAVVFFGAAETQAKKTGLRRDPADEAFLIPVVARARKALGAVTFADAECRGRALAYEEATATARTWLESGC